MKLNMFRKCVLASALATGFALSGAAQAALTFDADGTGPGGAISVTKFDWSPTSFLAMGANTAISNFQNDPNALPGQYNFDVLIHAKLANFVDANGGIVTLASATGNANAELTYVARFKETVTFVAGNFAGFEIIPDANSFFEMYYDANGNSNNVTGFGFNDGTLIMRSSTTGNSSGNFSVDDPTAVPFVTGIGPNADSPYTGQKSVTGGGHQNPIAILNSTIDTNFFQTALTSFSLNFQSISLDVPFDGTAPSDCFALNGRGAAALTSGYNTATYCDNAHVDGLMSANGPAPGANAYVPNIGALNGSLTSGPDFEAQTDQNSTVNGTPEPGVLALLGIALVGAGSLRRGRNR